MGGNVETPTLDAVLENRNSSFKSIILKNVSSSAQKSTIDSLGLLLDTDPGSDNGKYFYNTIKFSAVNGGGSISLKADSFRIVRNHV